jgi:geranylgeranylglycerol-phosphate geranylgeranyltransferase
MDNRIKFTENGDKSPYQITYVNSIKRATYNGNNYDNSDREPLVKTETMPAILFKHYLVQYFKVIVYYAKARSNVYIFAFATFISLLLGSSGNFSANSGVAVSAVISSYLLALSTYVYNDATDLQVDKINGTKRPSVTGRANKKQLIVLVTFLNTVALLLATSINLSTLLVASSFTVIGIAYSHPKINLKNKFPLKTVVTAAGAALLSLLGGTSAVAASDNIGSPSPPLHIPVLYVAFSFFAFFFVLGPLGDIGDLKGDKSVGRRTFPIVIGMRSTIFVMLSIPVLITIVLVVTTTISVTTGYNTTPYVNDKSVFQTRTLGLYATIGVCITTFLIILHIYKKINDVSAIKSTRPKMRLMHVLLQLTLLLTFL